MNTRKIKTAEKKKIIQDMKIEFNKEIEMQRENKLK